MTRFRRRVIRVQDLEDQLGTPHPRPMLYCARCGEQYSANRGDYFYQADDTVLACCGDPLQLAREHRWVEAV